MAKFLGDLFTEPPATIKIVVDFYDETHRELLYSSPAGALLQEKELPKEIEISTANFLVYYLFYKKRYGAIGYSSYNEICKKKLHTLIDIDGLIEYQRNSLHIVSLDRIDSGTTERFGVAIGLSVISKLHDLIDTDWSEISESNVKTLDYEYRFDDNHAASDGGLIVKVENKGAVNKNNNNKTSNISNHKNSIGKKKLTDRDQEDVISKSILYGTIAVLDDREDSIAKCWLLDPPMDMSSSPRRFRILARLNAIADLISFIGSRSQLSAALQTRLAALNALDEIDYLDGVPLRKGDGGEFPTETYDLIGYHNPWFAVKSRVIDGPAGGQVFQLDQKNLFFIGIREDLLVYAIEQKFDVISTYGFESGVMHKQVFCMIASGRFNSEFSVSQSENLIITKTGGYVKFELGGYLYYSNGGMVFGILPLPEAAANKNTTP